VLGESGDAEMMIDDAARTTHALRAAEQRAGGVRLEARLAQRGPAARAGFATATAGNEGRHDVIARP